MNSKILLLTAFDAPYESIANLSLPGMAKYATRHRCEFRAVQQPQCDRPHSWLKIPLIRQALDEHFDYVWWIDADTLFVRDDVDIRSEITSAGDFGIAWHDPDTTIWEESPGLAPHYNAGVMFIRSCDWARDFFARVWDFGEGANHPWHEQTAILHFLGYDHLVGLGPENPQAPDRNHVTRLDPAWNSIPGTAMAPNPIIHHYAGMTHPARLSLMHLDHTRLCLAAQPGERHVHALETHQLAKRARALGTSITEEDIKSMRLSSRDYHVQQENSVESSTSSSADASTRNDQVSLSSDSVDTGGIKADPQFTSYQTQMLLAEVTTLENYYRQNKHSHYRGSKRSLNLFADFNNGYQVSRSFFELHARQFYWTMTRLCGLAYLHDGSALRSGKRIANLEINLSNRPRPWPDGSTPKINDGPRTLIDVTRMHRNQAAGGGIQRVAAEIARGAVEFENALPVIIKNGRLLTYFGHPDIPDVVEIRKGDRFLIVDAAWCLANEYHPVLREVIRRGGSNIWCLHDIIPLLYPGSFEPAAVKLFDEWFRSSLAYYSAVIAVSKSVAEDFINYVSKNRPHQNLRVGWFHLGADFANEAAEPISKMVREVSETTFFLAVGTIEPRKNHHTLLAAFDRLWKAGVDVRLVIVGKYGWLARAISDQILQHPENGRRLFWFDAANDSELKLLYCNAMSVIEPSIAEGFGLPLVEAAHVGTPLIVSDIRVFREIGKNSLAYFDPMDSEALAQCVRSALSLPRTPPSIVPLRWMESTRRLLELIRDDAYQYEIAPAKRRLLIVTDDISMAGTYRVAEQLARGLSASFDVQLALGHTEINAESRIALKKASIKLIDYPVSSENLNQAAFRTIDAEKMLKDSNPDLVLSIDATAYSLLALKHVAKTCKIPFMATINLLSEDNPQSSSVLSERATSAWEAAKAIIVVSNADKARFRVKFPHIGAPLYAIPNSCPDGFFSAKDTRMTTRRSLGVERQDIVFINVARIEPRKGQILCIKALDKVRQSQDISNVRLIFVGDGCAGHINDVWNEIAKKKLSKHVQVLGYRTDIADLLDASDVFVLASYKEGMPISIIEAMARARPVIATAVDGIPEQIDNGVSGILVPSPGLEENIAVDAIASAMIRLLRDPETIVTIGRSAKQRAQKVFTEARMISDYERIIIDVISSSGTRTPADAILNPPLEQGSVIVFSDPIECWKYAASGWYPNERDGIWSAGKTSVIKLGVRADKENLSLTFDLTPFSPSGHLQATDVSINGAQACSWIFDSHIRQSRTIQVEVRDDEGPEIMLEIQFQHKFPATPTEFGLSDDSRELAICFHQLAVE